MTFTGNQTFLGSLKVLSVGTMTVASSSITLYARWSGMRSHQLGSATYPNLILRYNGGGADFNGQTVNIGGDLTLGPVDWGGTFSNGTLNVGGNVTSLWSVSNSQLISGTGVVRLTGKASGQTLAGTSGGPQFPNLTFNHGANPLTVTGAVTVNSTTSVTSGNVNLAGSALTTGALSLNSNTLTKGGGILTVGGVAQGTGSLFGGTVSP
jgi:hypothetical protein